MAIFRKGFVALRNGSCTKGIATPAFNRSGIVQSLFKGVVPFLVWYSQGALEEGGGSSDELDKMNRV